MDDSNLGFRSRCSRLFHYTLGFAAFWWFKFFSYNHIISVGNQFALKCYRRGCGTFLEGSGRVAFVIELKMCSMQSAFQTCQRPASCEEKRSSKDLKPPKDLPSEARNIENTKIFLFTVNSPPAVLPPALCSKAETDEARTPEGRPSASRRPQVDSGGAARWGAAAACAEHPYGWEAVRSPGAAKMREAVDLKMMKLKERDMIKREKIEPKGGFLRPRTDWINDRFFIHSHVLSPNDNFQRAETKSPRIVLHGNGHTGRWFMSQLWREMDFLRRARKSQKRRSGETGAKKKT